jgi:methylase of polypeptide subunit release factors
MLSTADLDRLRDDLVAAGYTIAGLTDRLGEPALAGLARNTSVAASRALGDDRDPQAAAIRLWLLQQPVAADDLSGWASLSALRADGLITGDTELRATVELKPHGSDRSEGWICSDVTPLDGRVGKPREDFVLGASPAATTLSQMVPPGRYGRALDLGTGCGIQALHLDAEQIVATDLNPRALALARISLRLSGITADLRLGSLYEPVEAERFDLIVTNPPYVMSPPDDARLVYREGGFTADDLVRQVVAGGAEHLSDGGTLSVLGNWAVTAGQPWEERLAEWIRPTGCDALVMQRELLDPYEYIEIWLTDAGLSGSPEYLERYRAWLDYFAGAGIEAVGMGWIALRKGGREHPAIRFDDWPHAVHQPVGESFGDFFCAVEPSRLAEPDFLSRSWRTHPGLVQETVGAPGAADPQHLVLRQQYGFGRAVEADTALAAIVGACDGDLPLGVLVGAVAGLLDVDAEALRDEVVQPLRRLVADGYLLLD